MRFFTVRLCHLAGKIWDLFADRIELVLAKKERNNFVTIPVSPIRSLLMHKELSSKDNIFSRALLLARSDYTSHSAMSSVWLVVCLW